MKKLIDILKKAGSIMNKLYKEILSAIPKTGKYSLIFGLGVISGMIIMGMILSIKAAG